VSAAEDRLRAVAKVVLEGDDLERRLALNVLLQIALKVARAEDEAVKLGTLHLLPYAMEDADL
jgi:hypothetical protein